MMTAAVSATQKDTSGCEGSSLFNIDELQWLCRNAYNLGITHVSKWHPRQTVRILTCCVEIIAKFPSNLPADVVGDLSLKSLFCNFMIASALAAMARTQDSKEQQLEDYCTMRRHISTFDTELQPKLKTLDSRSSQDLLDKLAILLVFDFEAAVNSATWDQLGQIVRKAQICKSVVSYQAMGDCLMRSNAPAQGEISTCLQIFRLNASTDWPLQNIFPS
jgi:hypothetical protein